MESKNGTSTPHWAHEEIGKSAMESKNTEVTVVNIKMPFWSMVTFMVKWAIAAIPAIIILVVIGAMLAVVMSGFFVGLHR